jgi:predicted phosphodiesterase
VGLKTYLILSDIHAPAHDPYALELAMRAGEIMKPHGVILNGDILDNHHTSSHGKSIGATWHFGDEVEWCEDFLDEIKQRLKPKCKVYLEGNHEERLSRVLASDSQYLIERDKAKKRMGQKLFDRKRAWSELCGIEKRGWTFIPYDKERGHWNIPTTNLYCTHAPFKGGVHAAKNSSREAGVSSLYGHVHTQALEMHAGLTGEKFYSACVGWLGDEGHPVMEYRYRMRPWQTGFATVIVNEATGRWHINLHAIHRDEDTYSLRFNDHILTTKRT